ncbi:MAG: hypothetical protein OXI16_02955 [Chloroflexota bacterium]|nr:hypothetical protein [Chloroflexota bacterium]
MTSNETPFIQLSVEASRAIWRIFGNGLAPLKQSTCGDMVEPIIRKQLGKTDEADQAIADIRSWFDSDGGPNSLRQEMIKPVAAIIVDGIRGTLSTATGIKNHDDTAFWAMGSIDPEVAATIVRSSWSPAQIDRFAGYVVDTLERLHKRGNIIDPKSIVGPDIRGATARTNEMAHDGPLRTFHAGLDAAYEGYRPMYSGIPSVVYLVLELKPEMLPQLVNKIQDSLLQSFAASCVADAHAASNHRQSLNWIADTSSTSLIALAILHILEIVHEREIASRTLPKPGAAGTADLTAESDPIADLVSRLAALGPARSTWWALELLNHTSYGPEQKQATAERVEQRCTQLLNDNILSHWSNEVKYELKDGLRRAGIEPRGKPLAEIAWGLRDAQPEKASQISGIILDEHEGRMAVALEDSVRFPYLAGRWNYQDWLTALAMAVVIHHRDVDPTDWVMEKCKALPLSAWDADEQDEVFHAADRVARTQMTVGLYAVQLLTDVGRVLDCDKLRTFAEKVWAHTDFIRQYGDSLVEDSGTAELAARVAAAFGESDKAWVLQQANSPAIDHQTLWTLLDQMKRQDNPVVHDNTFEEIRRIASDRYINSGEANPQSAPHLANLWVLLDGPREAAKTAQVLVAYHPSLADRAYAISTLKMLAFAECREELGDDLVETSRSLYDDLWGKHTPPDEMPAQQEIDAFLGWAKAAPSQDS